MNTKKANKVLADIVQDFESNDTIPKYMADTLIRAPEVPCSKWSVSNQILMQAGGRTDDARGYNQWRAVGRYVKKGSKARYILAPMVVPNKDEDKDPAVVFRCVPVFAIQDTDGEALPEYKPVELPPLAELAEIKYRNSAHGEAGTFNTETGVITLSSENAGVFFHELVHKYDAKSNELKGGQDPAQEIVAELGSAVLSRMYDIPHTPNHMAYIAGYAGAKTPAQVGSACLKLADRTMQAIRLILADAAKLS